MVEAVLDSDWQSLQNFTSHSPWSGQGLLDQVARDANHLIGGDAFYGDDPEFLRQLYQMGETFMLDIHKDQTVYLEDPAPYVLELKSARGRTPTRLKTDQLAVEVGQWADEQSQSAWEKILVRNSTKGFIFARVLHREVWLWDGKEQQAHKRYLVVSDTNLSKNNRKYSLSNAPSDTPIQRFVNIYTVKLKIRFSCKSFPYTYRSRVDCH